MRATARVRFDKRRSYALGGLFDFMKRSQNVVARDFARNQMDNAGAMWIYEINAAIVPKPEGHFEVLVENEFKKMVIKFMDKDDYTIGHLNGVLELIPLMMKSSRNMLKETHLALSDGLLDCRNFDFTPFPEQWTEGKQYAKGDSVRYGIANYEAKLDGPNPAAPPSSDLTEWAREFSHAKTALMHVPLTHSEVFDGADECPKWLEFLSQIFVEEDGVTPCPELVKQIGLMCGYFLMPHLKANKIFFLSGPTANNGKSTFLQIIKSLMPDGSYEEKKFKEFASSKSQSYGRAELVGKKLVICNEESSRDIDSGALKEFADGMSTMEARRIYGHPFSFLPTFTIVAAFNTPPSFDNVDAGVIRRFLYFPCNAKFDGSKSVDEVIGPILEERMQILAWMLRQAKRLHDMKWLFPPETEMQKMMKADMLEDQNSIAAFARERLEIGEGYRTEVNALYAEYVAYCKDNGSKPFSSRAFARRGTVDQIGEAFNSNGIRYRRARIKCKDDGKPQF